MKIVRFASGGEIFLGQMVSPGRARPIQGDLFGDWVVEEREVAIERLLAPIVPADILCIGVNYRKHAEETGSAIPQTPMLFIKASTTLNDPHGIIVAPFNSTMVDFEAELCVVIGKAARHVSRENALEHVFGYTCANDVSARDWQRDKSLSGGQFARGKSFDTFCPLGPWIVTRDEIPNPNALSIRCVLNGQVVQDSNTCDMIYDVPALIASLSSTLTLRPGTVILTGTPSGVGMGRTPPLWLKSGDSVVVEIGSIGRLENTVSAELAPK
ncbi:MAG TPA: fumarylacetoacetate hydrolase family protein [Tepidisphaeraceae bacterium]|jgi:2-keto-4-pentenoate hydratase/2-oxohepta-3-ene-1,7-dioic acid hydratase in catechol pathway